MIRDKLTESLGKVPRFIKLRGCINCEASKIHKKKTGYDYGFDHEDVILCMADGCVDYGHDLCRPFIDPEEVVKFAAVNGNGSQIQNTRNYLSNVKKRFGHFYERIGVDLNLS